MFKIIVNFPFGLVSILTSLINMLLIANVIFLLANWNFANCNEFDWDDTNIGEYITSTVIKEYPYHVSLIRGEDKFICNGAIIHPLFVMTSGACVSSLRRPLTCDNEPCPSPFVRSGSSSYSNGGKLHTIKSLGINANHSFLNPGIGLVEVNEPFDYFGFPLVLPKQKADVEPETEAVVTAWTRKVKGEKKKPLFQRFNVQVWPTDKCNKQIGPLKNHICTQAENKKCIDDMGAPLVTKGNLLIGIMVRSVVPCQPDNPRLYALVSPYTDVIRDTIAKTTTNQYDDTFMVQYID